MISTILLIVLIIAFFSFSCRLLFWPYNKQWEELFKSGQVPKTFLGPNNESQEWSIRMVTGPILSMDFWPLRHRKHIHQAFTGYQRGYNKFFKDLEWGFFVKDTNKDGNYCILDYDNHKIKDLVRTTPNPDVMVGKFYYKLFGKYRFLSFFIMQRVKNA